MSEIRQRIIAGLAVAAALLLPAVYGWTTGQVGPCAPLYMVAAMVAIGIGVATVSAVTILILGVAIFAITGDRDWLPGMWTL